MSRTGVRQERAILVGVFLKSSSDRFSSQESLQELQGLARTAGLFVVGCIQTVIDEPKASTFLGKGKIEEIARLRKALEANVVVSQSDLSPVQQRNIEDAVGAKVLNRTELIFDIFAQHADSKAGKLQVELAQLQYRLSHLAGHGVWMSRLGGGIGTRGPGETKLETDRRRIAEKITKLSRDLKKLSRRRAQQRKARLRSSIPIVSLVGYTNAGKSTLLNALTRAQVPARDQLFTTLDTTTRKLEFHHRQFLFSDTVGFIQNMPKDLKEAFAATLEEINTASLIIHVVDVSASNRDERIRAVVEVLDELNVLHKPLLTVFNKTDRMKENTEVDSILRRYAPACLVTASKLEGLPELLEKIDEILSRTRGHVVLNLPLREVQLRAQIHQQGCIISEEFKSDQVEIECEIPDHLYRRIEPFVLHSGRDN